ncbi:CRISPR-associated protein Csx11 [Caldithrix abyssi]
MNNLNNVTTNKDEILKAEVGTLLFNVGKTHAGLSLWKKYFTDLEQKFSGYKDYFDKVFEDELKGIDNSLYEFFLDQIKVKLPNGKELKWKEFIYGDVSEDKFIQKVFFRGCENINSGIDKGSPKEDNQLKTLWIANAFGSFKQEVEKEFFDAYRKHFFSKLHHFLERENYYSQPDWSEIREFIVKEIKTWYSNLLSDSRFPINDVTLFDQAYMTASMFKTVFAGLFLENSKFQEYEKNPQSIRWSILGIQYDKLSLAEKGLKPGFIQWYRSACERADQAIKQLLEIRYPIGNEVYRDETGIYFVVAENLSGKSDGDFYELSPDLQELKQKIWDIFSTTFGGEIYPTIRLTKPSRGLMNLGHLIEKAEENFLKAERPENFVEKLQKGISSGEAGLCQVCRMRPADRGDDETLICEVCRERREGRIKSWLNHPEDETIWTGELQDKHGRMALVTLKFELKKWLNGDFLNTLLIQNEIYKTNLKEIENFIFLFLKKSEFNVDVTSLNEKVEELSERLKNSKSQEEKRRLGENKGKLISIKNKIEKLVNIINAIKNSTWWEKSLKNDIGISAFTGKGIEEIVNILIEDYNEIKKEFPVYELENISFFPTILAEDAYKGCKNNDETFEDFVRQVFFGSIVGTFWEEIVKSKFGNDKIDWTFGKEKILWDNLTTSDIEFLSQLFLQFLLRKNPSPARLRRIWETTHKFFEEINKTIVNLIEISQWRQQRLVFEIDSTDFYDKNNEYVFKGLQFWLYNNHLYLIDSVERFLEVFNNEYLKKLYKSEGEVKISPSDFNHLVNQEWEIVASGNSNAKPLTVTIRSVQVHSYKPLLSIIDPTPVSWQFVMPADRVPVLLEKLKDRYNENFKWVYGKLPLHVGIVVQHYKRPLYVGIKALRKIRRDHASWIDLRQETSGCYLKAKQKEAFQFAHPAEVENGSESFYSLYELPDKEGAYEFYLYPEPDGKRWLYTTQNHDDQDRFYFYPNTFDFEFLDANARRNDVYYQRAKRAASLKTNRPYWLDDFKYFQEFRKFINISSSISKFQKLVSLIYSRLEDWEDADSLKTFMLTAFVNMLDLKSQKKKDQFACIINCKNWHELEDLPPGEFMEKLKMLLDMFNFYHSMLKLLPEEER